MNKFLASLLAGAFTLSLGSAAFAADAVKPSEPAKVEAAKVADPAKAEATTPAAKATPAKKHHHKHAKKAAAVNAPTEAAKDALTGK